jgi:hypothetical protein
MVASTIPKIQFSLGAAISVLTCRNAWQARQCARVKGDSSCRTANTGSGDIRTAAKSGTNRRLRRRPRRIRSVRARYTCPARTAYRAVPNAELYYRPELMPAVAVQNVVSNCIPAVSVRISIPPAALNAAKLSRNESRARTSATSAPFMPCACASRKRLQLRSRRVPWTHAKPSKIFSRSNPLYAIL